MTIPDSDHNPEQSSPARKRTSLRTRITLTIITIAGLTVVVIGFFVLSRSQQVQDLLGSQFEQAVLTRTDDQLLVQLDREAQAINQFFVNVDEVVETATLYTASILAQEEIFSTGAYWDASTNLRRLGSGAWDNANSDPAAIFVPAHVQPGEQMFAELNTAIHLDFFAPNILQSNPDIVGLYYISRDDLTIYYPNIDLANLVAPDFTATQQLFYTAASPGNNPGRARIWTPPYQDPALTGLIVTNSSPVYDENARFRGVIGADVQLATITRRVLEIRIGETGYAFLIDPVGRLIALPDRGYQDFNIAPEEVPVNEVPQLTVLQAGPAELLPLFEAMTSGESDLAQVTFNDVDYYLAYQPIPAAGYSIGIIVPVNEMNAAYIDAQTQVQDQASATFVFGLLLSGLALAGSVLASYALGRLLTSPLNRLTEVAERISEGELDAVATETSRDEIGSLAHAFNLMTARLRANLTALEQGITERTTDLTAARESNQRRVAQFTAITKIGKTITSVEGAQLLLPRVTTLISEQLDFYHVGIFLNDEEGRYTVLRASNSESGRRMLDRGHRLEIGQVGIVGYVANTGNPRIALDTGADAFFFRNPDLPETRSEMALPLRIGTRILGVLDVQSKAAEAFNQDDISVLSLLADQISIAIENTRLFQETRQALDEVQNTYRQYIRQEWQVATAHQESAGYRYTGVESISLAQPVSLPGAEESVTAGQIHTDYQPGSPASMAIPIKLRGETIGVVDVRSNLNRPWSPDEIDIVQAASERLALALENARLVSAAQRRATKERTIAEIAAKISSLVDVDDLLRSAASEVSRVIPGAEVAIQFQNQSKV
ncbi:MAG: GAF domain-containing protein [Anaerolineales bacterium]|nr:GAF domain-containing protein [Anaerolineales bacterium]